MRAESIFCTETGTSDKFLPRLREEERRGDPYAMVWHNIKISVPQSF